MNGAKNISKNPYSLYNQIFRSNARVLILTATVIFNNTIEWCLIGNLLKDDTFPDIINGGKFDKNIEMHERNVFNDEKMNGIISYFPGYETDHPEVIHHKPIKVLLSLSSSSILENIIDIETTQIAALRSKEEKLGYLSPDERRQLILLLKRIRSRSFSNINYQVLHLNKYKDYYFKLLKKRNLIELENRLKIMDVFKNYDLPHVIIKNIDKFIDKDEQKRVLNMLRELKVNIVYDIVQNCVEKCTKKYIKEQLDNQNFEIDDDELDEILTLDIENVIIPDYQVNKGGWISHDILHDKILNYACPKIVAIIVNILKNINTKQVVFSYFIKRGGLLFLYTLLSMCGIKCEIYSGEVSAEKRSQILDKFNSIENRDGKIIKVLLTTEAGCEGITMLEVEHVHILETNPNTNKTLQCIGRAARYRSHINLPKERQIVNVWKYHATIVIKSQDIIKNGKVVGFKKVTQGPDIDLNFLNTFEEYYDYYIKGGNIKLLKKVYGDGSNLEINFGGGIDKMLDEKSTTNKKTYKEFYDILQKYSIERTGLIDKVPSKPLSEPKIKKSNEEIIREIINNYKGDAIKKSEIKRILKIKNIEINKLEFDKIIEKIMNE
jgi:superfamily II DNA/RNA helicase